MSKFFGNNQIGVVNALTDRQNLLCLLQFDNEAKVSVDVSDNLLVAYDQSKRANHANTSGIIPYSLVGKFAHVGTIGNEQKRINIQNLLLSYNHATIIIIGNFYFDPTDVTSNAYLFGSGSTSNDCYAQRQGGIVCDLLGTRTWVQGRTNINDQASHAYLQGNCVVVFSFKGNSAKIYINNELIQSSSTVVIDNSVYVNCLFGGSTLAYFKIICKYLYEYRVILNDFEDTDFEYINKYAVDKYKIDIVNAPTISNVVINYTTLNVGDTLSLSWDYNQNGADIAGDYFIVWKRRTSATNIITAGLDIIWTKNTTTCIIPNFPGQYIQCTIVQLDVNGLAPRHRYLSSVVRINP